MVSKNFDFRNSSELCNITQFFDASKSHADASKIRIVIDPSEHRYEYVDIYREAASIHDPWNISVIEIGYSNLFEFLSEPIYNPEIEDGKIVKEFCLTMNGGMIADRAIADSLGNKIDEWYISKKLSETGGYSVEDIDSSFLKYWNDTPLVGTTQANIYLGMDYHGIPTGNYLITTYKSGIWNDPVGFQKLEGCSITYGIYARNRYNSTWSEWKKIV